MNYQDFKLNNLTDIPTPIEKDQDTLQVLQYVQGLENFIKMCHTPMSISLQGDWGTGKTTFLKTMENDFKNDLSVKTVYFNTWQYSQFNMSDSLFISLLSNIINQLIETDKSIENDADQFLKKIIKIVKIAPWILADAVLSKTVDSKASDYKEELGFKEEKEQAKDIHNLKEEFKKLIQKVNNSNSKKNNTEYSRVVVFIDDLDRLEPQRAVEMLEVLKLFMDVEGCVYILAIDYDVVVAGVREKYGDRMTKEKCRAFFDKIIQLPFNMPVERYDIKPLIKNIIKSNLFGNYVDIVSDFIRDTLGSNPRAIKRLINSFFLLTNITNEDKAERSPLQQSLLLLILTVQMCNLDAYHKLHLFTDAQKLTDYFDDLSKKEHEELDEKELKINKIMVKLYNTIQEISDEMSDDNIGNVVEQIFAELKLSSITSKSIESVTAIKEEFITIIDDQQKDSSTQISAMVHIVNELLKDKSHEEIDELVSGNKFSPKLLTYNSEKGTSYFRVVVETNIQVDNKKVYLGASTNIKTKCDFLKGLVNYLGNKNKIFLKKGDTILFPPQK